MLISKPQIDEVIREVIMESVALNPNPESNTIVVVGGTAMCINKIRMASYDIDVYCGESTFKVAALLEGKFKAKYGNRFRLDVTMDSKIWGSINIGDIADSPIYDTIELDGNLYPVRTLDPATLFILKSSSARDRDIDDVDVIRDHVKIDSILKRMAELVKFNPDTDFIETVLSEIQAQYLEPISEAMIDKLNLDGQRKRELMESFLIARSAISHG